MQTANVHELKELLLKTDEEFRQLATQHHELDDRLHESRLPRPLRPRFLVHRAARPIESKPRRSPFGR